MVMSLKGYTMSCIKGEIPLKRRSEGNPEVKSLKARSFFSPEDDLTIFRDFRGVQRKARVYLYHSRMRSCRYGKFF